MHSWSDNPWCAGFRVGDGTHEIGRSIYQVVAGNALPRASLGHIPRANDYVFKTVEFVCDLMDQIEREANLHPELLLTLPPFPGRDNRSSSDLTNGEVEIGWRAQESFETGICGPVGCWLDNKELWRLLHEKVYSEQGLGVFHSARACGRPCNGAWGRGRFFGGQFISGKHG